MKIYPSKMDYKSEDNNFEQIPETAFTPRQTPRNNRIEKFETENLMTEVHNNIFQVPQRRNTIFLNTRSNTYN